jgi:hypothetical protein
MSRSSVVVLRFADERPIPGARIQTPSMRDLFRPGGRVRALRAARVPWREGPVERDQVRVVEVDDARGGVVSDVLRRRRTRDGVHAVVAQHPSQGDLRRCRVVALACSRSSAGFGDQGCGAADRGVRAKRG